MIYDGRLLHHLSANVWTTVLYLFRSTICMQYTHKPSTGCLRFSLSMLYGKEVKAMQRNIPGDPKKRYPRFYFAITSVNLHRF